MYKFVNQHKFSEDEINFLVLVISQVGELDQRFKQYIVYKSDFPKKINFNNFLSKPLNIEENSSYFMTNWLTSIDFVNELYKVSISEKLKPYLVELNKNYDVDGLTNLIVNGKIKEVVKVNNKNLANQNDNIIIQTKRVVNFFDQERKKIQQNYVRREFKNIDGEYLLRKHLKETGRTAKMFNDAVRWLFSTNPKASFHRQNIMNIGKLIEHFNVLEHQAMYSKEAIEFNEETQIWVNIYRKQGMPEDEILEKLREAGYIS
ncbi:RepB family plasmid replication initiator protein [Sulfurimonas sp.]|uniref:RepB family plasmid replication initiator protein n=1 Tax=Sulfurimonas sp. TaxID=2022749 RepID=UPI002B46BA12|nr:RepB family plasmid replication initiator protein [Sulfurimonas sp.]